MGNTVIARNLLLGLRPLREPVARPEAGKRGLRGKRGIWVELKG